MDDEDGIRTLSAHYATVRPLYERLVNEVCDVLKEQISKHSITAVTVAGRAKTVESFASKIPRKKYTDPLT
jgi:hypothetical protein